MATKCLPAVGITLALILGLACDKQGQQGGGSSDTPYFLVGELTRPDPPVRMEAAKKLAELPAEQLKTFVPDIKKAYKAERHKGCKAALKKLLAHCSGS